MKSVKRNLAVGALLAGSMSVGNVVYAGASGNVAVNSDYLWRGMTQTGHSAAVSGGLDYEHDSGLYIGTWTSNVAANTEVDFYGGFSKAFGPVEIDLGGIYYAYPHAGTSWANFYEVYGGLSAMGLGVTGYYNIESEDIYVSGEYEYEISDKLKITLSGGATKSTKDLHYGLTLTKTLAAGDFSATISDTTADDGTIDAAPTLVVGYSKEFDF
ncbi:MAG: TorF family putative porin [Gammaproteobacteria bacterium]|nr:TorF family putative porin [Gammaproteobacteria bacterium]